jgi:hypothetical protein
MGWVETSEGDRLPSALVQVWGTGRLLSEGATDQRGEFNFDVPLTDVRRVSVHFLGYQTVVLAAEAFSTSPVQIRLSILPVALPELKVLVDDDVCDGRDDPVARALWAAARSRYSPETGYRGGAAAVRFSAGSVDAGAVGTWSTTRLTSGGPEVWVGATDSPTPGRFLLFERIVESEGYAWKPEVPTSGLRTLHWVYPRLEGRRAYHFGTAVFGALHTFRLIRSGPEGSELAFCPQDTKRPNIRGRLFLAADTTFSGAQWSFRTDSPKEGAGGEVVFARTPDSEGTYHLVSAQGIFWRRDGDEPRSDLYPPMYVQIVWIADEWWVGLDEQIPEHSGR